MAFVSVPKDLTKVKNKIILNLTKRQLICLGTVSYTHLDVYKRQIQTNIGNLNRDIKAANSLMQSIRQIDVYKRQVSGHEAAYG